jgi:hypothetical protein
MPIGFAGRATAGRLSGAGTTLGFLRVGLGDGVASADSVGVAESVGSGDSVGEADAESEGDAAALGIEAAGDGVGDGNCVALDALGTDGGGEPAGVAVHPASTPAHTRALRAVTERLTPSG